MFCIVEYWLKFYTIQDKTAQVLKFSKVSLGQDKQYKTCQAFILIFFFKKKRVRILVKWYFNELLGYLIM